MSHMYKKKSCKGWGLIFTVIGALAALAFVVVYSYLMAKSAGLI